MATCGYRIYGLALRSNRPLPHLVSAALAAAEDTVDLRFGTGASRVARARVRYGDDTAAVEFGVDATGSRVWADWSGAGGRSPIVGATALLAGPVLGGLLRLRGTTSLHGCAVAVDGGAIVLLGRQGAGKSTLAAALAQRGHPVLADDVAALGEHPGGWTVQPGYPRLRLAPATIASLCAHGAPPHDAGPVLLGHGKRYVALSSGADAVAWRFAPEPLALRAVYVLSRAPGRSAPEVRSPAGAERLALLVRHVRAALWPLPADVRADELARLARLAASIPILRLTCPDGIDALGSSCRLLAGALDAAA